MKQTGGSGAGGGGKRGICVSSLCGLAVLLVLCVARAAVADYSQDMHLQRRSQRSSDETASLVPGPRSYHGHRRRYIRGHRLYRRRSKHSPRRSLGPNPVDRSPPQSSRDKTVSPGRNPFNNPDKLSDCDVYKRSQHAQNKTHVASLEEVDYLLCQYYTPWSSWRRCNRSCQQRRVRRCRVPEQCGTTKLKEHRSCRRKRSHRCSSLNSQAIGDFRGQNQQIERVLFDALYTDWSEWSSCTRSCKQRRRRRCTVREVCQGNFVQETRRCSVPGSRCERLFKPVPESDLGTTAAGTSQPPDLSTTTEEADIQPTGNTTKPAGPQGNKRNTEEHGEAEGGDSNQLAAAQRTCGRRPLATRGSYRVVGGQEAQRLSWPWQVAILTRWEEQYCAGTLIAPGWLLTAAHCVRKRGRRRRIIVRAGEHNLEEFEGSEQDVKPQRDYPHPEFDYATIINDIALVHLKTALEERTHPGYACLPEPGFRPDRDALCYILGWGKRRNTHLFGTEVLHEAEVPLVTPKRCQKVFDYHINATQVCAGYRRGGVDACSGDSGGPLLCPQTKAGITRWFLVGITSYGEGCGRRGKYGIYTRVTSYLDWITETILSR